MELNRVELIGFHPRVKVNLPDWPRKSQSVPIVTRFPACLRRSPNKDVERGRSVSELPFTHSIEQILPFHDLNRRRT